MVRKFLKTHEYVNTWDWIIGVARPLNFIELENLKLKKCLTTQKKQRIHSKIFEWMGIFLQNRVQGNPYGNISTIPIMRSGLHREIPNDLNPMKSL